jgi:pyridoxal biosynthesis lyase PdxS
MKRTPWGRRICSGAAMITLLMLAAARPVSPAIKNIAVVMSSGSKIEDVQLSELVKLCKGLQKTWIEGKNFTLVMTDPGTPEMRAAVQKLFGMTPAELKTALAKLNESRVLIRIVDNDGDLLGETAGAVGLVDVYSINSTVRVLRVDGKLPFDLGYALKGN